MQPYYIHAAKKDTTKHPTERHAYNTNKASEILRTPLGYTTHMETAYYIINR